MNSRLHFPEAAAAGIRCLHQCLLAHGHAVYGEDFPYQRRLRDVMGLEAGDGTRGIMNRIIVCGLRSERALHFLKIGKG